MIVNSRGDFVLAFIEEERTLSLLLCEKLYLLQCFREKSSMDRSRSDEMINICEHASCGGALYAVATHLSSKVNLRCVRAMIVLKLKTKVQRHTTCMSIF